MNQKNQAQPLPNLTPEQLNSIDFNQIKPSDLQKFNIEPAVLEHTIASKTETNQNSTNDNEEEKKQDDLEETKGPAPEPKPKEQV